MNQLSSEVYRARELLQKRGSSALASVALEGLKGRLTELSSSGDHAAISLAVRLVASCHAGGEPAAWVWGQKSLFYPPDAARWGVDWGALALVQARDSGSAGRAADKLLRSGAFGLVVVDLFDRPALPPALLGRLLHLAERHESGVVFLTTSLASSQSISALISLRILASWTEVRPERLSAEFRVIKDKRRGPGESIKESYYGPLGLR